MVLSVMKKILTTLILLTFLPIQSFAQNDEDLFKESMRDFTVVIGSGLGGAVLGLSTLSFVEEPKDHLKNILVGGSIGIIIGVGLVAYNQANRSKEMYKSKAYNIKSPNFETAMRNEWHDENFDLKKTQIEAPALSFQTSF